MEHYYSLDVYNRETFGRKLYKLSLPGGTTCPNRDGTKGFGGCIFCSAGGSGEFTPDAALSVTEQLERAKQRVRQKIREDAQTAQFIAYFQSFTATYAPIETQRARFFEAAAWPQTAVVDVATRPDCLPPQVLALLRELRQIKPVWVELGLQTANDDTAVRIGRGYETREYVEAVKALHEIGVPVITHVILGLPGETRKDVLRTIETVNEVASDGVKLQLLHVLRGTALAETAYTPMDMDAYIDLLLDCIAHLDMRIVVHRLTGDGDKRLLLSPLWSADKKRVLNAVHRAMRERAVVQGSACKKP
ncbi:MAG: TIGR01212 family radical SAM protein [Clostridia bacterium]|nr:TIGR01212 family radical SAM protein [Clostridia bacterium]